MEKSRVSLIHLYTSTAIAVLCALWLFQNPDINIKIIIFIQLITIIVSFFHDAPLRNKLIKIISFEGKKPNSLDGFMLYIKIMSIGTITIVLAYGLAFFFIDYKNNPDNLLFAVSIITIFLIWLAHNWCVVKIHEEKL